jgi:hypothetical protein
MILELARVFSFVFSLLSLFPVMLSAFFEPGARWEERLEVALLKIAVASCICFASGLLFSLPSPAHPQGESVWSTLPVRLLFWALGGMAILFAVSWYLDVHYMPWLPHPCCRP